MRLLAEAEIAIARPPQAVFDLAADLTQFGRWFPGVLTIRAGDELPATQPGHRYHETVALPGGRRRDITITVTVAEPGRRLVTEGAMPPLLPRMEMTFASDGAGGTRLHWSMHRRGRSIAAWLLAVPAGRLMRRRAEAGLARLKLLLETAEPAQPLA